MIVSKERNIVGDRSLAIGSYSRNNFTGKLDQERAIYIVNLMGIVW